MRPFTAPPNTSLRYAGLLICSFVAASGLWGQECDRIVIDRLRPGTAAADADLRLDDRLLSWRIEATDDGVDDTGPRGGDFCSWWQVYELEFTVSKRHRIELRIDRDGETLTRTVAADRWGFYVSPTLPDGIAGRWRSGLRQKPALEEGSQDALWLLQQAEEKPGSLGRWLFLQHAARDGQTAVVEQAVQRFDSAPWLEKVALLDRLVELLYLRQSRTAGPPSQRLVESVDADSPLRQRALFVRASALSQVARLQEAQGVFREALEAGTRSPGATFLVRDIWKNLGVARGRSGDLLGAELAFLEGQQVGLALGQDKDPGLLNNLGIVARRRGDTERALSYFREALELVTPGSRPHRDLLTNLANLYKHNGAPIEALHFLAQLPEPPREQIEEHLNWAFQIAEAQALAGSFVRAAEILAPLSDTAQELLEGSTLGARWTVLLGDLARDRGDGEEALALYSDGIEQFEAVVPNSFELAQPRAERAELLLELGRDDEAFAEYLRTCDVLDGSLPAIGGGSTGTASFRSRFWPLYRKTIELALQRNDPNAALALMQRARRRQRLEFTGREQRQEQARQATALQDLAGRAAGLAGPEKEAVLQELEERRAVYRTRFLALDDTNRQGGLPALDEGDLFVAYLLGSDTSAVLWQPAGGELSWSEIPIGEQDLAVRATELVELLSRPAGAVQERRRSRILDELSRLLLGPLEDQLRDSERLLLSLDGALHRLPWAVLPLPHAGAALVERLEIMRLPDVSGDVSRAHLASGLRAVVAADPDQDDLMRLGQGELERLPAARVEADAIALTLGTRSTLLEASSASESAVLEATRGANVLHLAAHTRADERFPLESAVYLAPDDRSDGILRAWELIEGEPLGELALVVLSSCESALGRDYRGQGFLGLVDAFFSAGAEQVMASLWRVNDRSTAALMSEFYRELADGRSAEASLRAAQLSMLRGEHGEALRDPFHWAAFAINLASN